MAPFKSLGIESQRAKGNNRGSNNLSVLGD